MGVKQDGGHLAEFGAVWRQIRQQPIGKIQAKGLGRWIINNMAVGTMWGKCGTHRVTWLHRKRRPGKFARRPFPRTARNHQHVWMGFNSLGHHQLVGPGWVDNVEERDARIAVFKKVETWPIKIADVARGHFSFALRVQSLVRPGHLLNPRTR